MSLSFNILVGVSLAYVALLFAVAYWADRRAGGGGALAPLAADLYAVAFHLLHRLDLLRRGGLRGAIGP